VVLIKSQLVPTGTAAVAGAQQVSSSEQEETLPCPSYTGKRWELPTSTATTVTEWVETATKNRK